MSQLMHRSISNAISTAADSQLHSMKSINVACCPKKACCAVVQLMLFSKPMCEMMAKQQKPRKHEFVESTVPAERCCIQHQRPALLAGWMSQNSTKLRVFHVNAESLQKQWEAAAWLRACKLQPFQPCSLMTPHELI